MADKRNGSDRACRCRQAHVDCVGVAVQRLSQERVLELAEEIWTASGADKLPAVWATRDPRGSQPGASAQAAYRHCREQERGAWRHSLLWRAGAVAAAALGSGLLIGLAEGVKLGWRMAVVAAWAAAALICSGFSVATTAHLPAFGYGDGKLSCNVAPRGRSGR